jgi:hypothetical protein
MLRRVALVRTDFVFLYGMRRLLVTANVVPSSPIVTLMMEALSSSETSFLQEIHGVTSQRTQFFIVTAVKTSNLTEAYVTPFRSVSGCLPLELLSDTTIRYEVSYIYVMKSEPISTAHFMNPYHPSVCLYENPFIVARLCLSKNVTAATHAQRAIQELFQAAISVISVSD